MSNPDASLRPRPGETAEDVIERVTKAVRTRCRGSGEAARIILAHHEHGFVTGCEYCDATVRVGRDLCAEEHEPNRSTIPETVWDE